MHRKYIFKRYWKIHEVMSSNVDNLGAKVVNMYGICMCVSMHMCVGTHVCVGMYVHVGMHVCEHTYEDVYVGGHACMCIHVGGHACVRVCICV